jgi:ElaB/YqjD/DUF883 family membrane-anchored ribosome-binding protein
MSILSSSSKMDSSNTKDKIHEISADIAEEFKCFVSDIENLIKETASLTGDELAQAKIKLNQRVNAAKKFANTTGNNLIDRARKTASVTNEYVHAKPWPIISASVLVSFALGILIGHCKESSRK